MEETGSCPQVEDPDSRGVGFDERFDSIEVLSSERPFFDPLRYIDELREIHSFKFVAESTGRGSREQRLQYLPFKYDAFEIGKSRADMEEDKRKGLFASRVVAHKF